MSTGSEMDKQMGHVQFRVKDSTKIYGCLPQLAITFRPHFVLGVPTKGEKRITVEAEARVVADVVFNSFDKKMESIVMEIALTQVIVTVDFNPTLNQVNWLGLVVTVAFIPSILFLSLP